VIQLCIIQNNRKKETHKKKLMHSPEFLFRRNPFCVCLPCTWIVAMTIRTKNILKVLLLHISLHSLETFLFNLYIFYIFNFFIFIWHRRKVEDWRPSIAVTLFTFVWVSLLLTLHLMRDTHFFILLSIFLNKFFVIRRQSIISSCPSSPFFFFATEFWLYQNIRWTLYKMRNEKERYSMWINK